MKTPSITIPISRPRLAFATGATAALLAVCSLPAQVVKPTGTLFWGASGGGGNGAWEDAGAWWAPATGAQHTWVSGTDANSTLTTYNNFIFTGTGRDAADPYVVTTALPFITSSNAAFIENAASRHTLLLDFRDNYLFKSTIGSGTTEISSAPVAVKGVKLAISAAAGKTVTFDGSDGALRIRSLSQFVNEPVMWLTGQGTINLGPRVTVEDDLGSRGRVTVGGVLYSGTNVVRVNAPVVNLTDVTSKIDTGRLFVDAGTLNINSGTVNIRRATGSNPTDIHLAPFHIGATHLYNCLPEESRPVVNLNGGYLKSVPTAVSASYGKWNGLSFATINPNNGAYDNGDSNGIATKVGNNGAGGTFNLNGGLFETTSIYANPDATGATTRFVFNSGTLKVASVAPATHLAAFIDGFKTTAQDNTGKKALVSGTGGAFIDTSAIAGKTAVILSELQGEGGLVKLGANTLQLAAKNTYAGTTIVRGGTLSLGVADAIASSTAVVVESAGVLAGTGAVTQTLRNLSGSGTLANAGGRLLAFNDAGESSTFSGRLALGAGGFGKTGAGVFILASDNSALAQSTLVAEGEFRLASGAKLGGPVTVENGAILGGLGDATGSVMLNAGGILRPGTGAAAGMLTVATLNLNPGSILGVNLAAGDASNRFSVTNPITFLSGATAADVALNLNALVTGTYALGNITGLATAAVKYDGLSIGGRQSAALSIVSGTGLQLTVDAGQSLKVIWTGQADGAWDISGTNWKKQSDSAACNTIFGDTVIFDDSLATARRDIGLATGMTVSDMVVNGTGNYSFTGYFITADAASVTGASLTGATGKLTMNGGGTLTLAPTGTNDFKDGIVLQSGVLVAATPGALGTAAITGGGTLAKTGADVLDLATDKLAATIALVVDEGTLRLSKPAAGAHTLANKLTGEGALAVRLTGTADALSLGAGSIDGFAGTLAVEDASFTLNAASAAQLSAATLGVGAGSHITKTAGDMSIGGLAFDGGSMRFAADGLAPDGLLTVGTLNTGGAGTETVVMMDLDAGGGLTEFNPAVPPAVNLLDHDNGSADGGKVIAVTGAVTGAGTFRLVGADGNPIAGSITSVIGQYVPGSTTNRENVADASYGVALVTGSDGLYLGSALTGVSVYDGRQLILDNSAPGVDNAFTIGISGSGGLRVQASGTIMLSGNNTYTGATTLASGVIRATRADIFKDSAAVEIAEGAAFEAGGHAQTLRNLSGAGTLDFGAAALTLDAAKDAATEFSGALIGAGAITKSGSGTLTLSGGGARGVGTTAIGAGRLVVKNNLSALGTGAVTVAPEATLGFSSITSGTFDMPVTGGGIVEVRDSNFAFGHANNRLSRFNLVNSTVLPTSSVHALGSIGVSVHIDSTSALHVSYGDNPTSDALRTGNVTVASGGKLLYGLNAAVNKLNLGGGVLTLEDGAVIGFAGRVPDGIYDLVEQGTGTVDRQGALILDEGPNRMAQWRWNDNDNDIELVTLSFDPTVQVSLTFDAMLAAMSAVYSRVSESFLQPVIEAGRTSKIHGVWMRGFASYADYDETAGQFGHTESTQGVLVGYDALSPSRKYLLGAYGGFSGGTLETDAGARSEADQQFAGLYAATKWGAFYIGLDGMAGWSQADNIRHQSDGGVSNGISKANYYGGSVEAGFIIQPFANFSLKPSAGLHYLNAEFDACKERGDSAISYPDIAQNLLQSVVSMQASWKFATPWGWPAMADLNYAWRQAVSEKSDDVTIRFVSDLSQAPYVIRGGDYSRAAHVIGGGLRAAVSDSLSLGISYAFEIASHRARHTVNGMVRFSW